MITVLLADDHAIVRDVLRLLLEQAGDIQIVAMAVNGREAVLLADLHSPNVAVMDISMPVMNGIEATRNIRINHPQTNVLMISMHNTSAHIKSCLQAGALGYVLKDHLGDELLTAVRSTYEGKRYFSEPIAGIARGFIH
jgi:two-component system, NarL family, nitrate/nitrite response regulator NarL